MYPRLLKDCHCLFDALCHGWCGVCCASLDELIQSIHFCMPLISPRRTIEFLPVDAQRCVAVLGQFLLLVTLQLCGACHSGSPVPGHIRLLDHSETELAAITSTPAHHAQRRDIGTPIPNMNLHQWAGRWVCRFDPDSPHSSISAAIAGRLRCQAVLSPTTPRSAPRRPWPVRRHRR